jgi:hypothetical protein
VGNLQHDRRHEYRRVRSYRLATIAGIVVLISGLCRLIAIMLGRLRMSIDGCRKAYLKLSERIFCPKRRATNLFGQATDFLLANGRFDCQELEAIIKEVIVEDCRLEEDILLQEPDPCCKV